MSRIRRSSVRALTLAAMAAALLAACGPGPTFQPVDTPAVPIGNDTGGDAIAPALGVPGEQRYLYRQDEPEVEIQQATRQMMQRLPAIIGVQLTPLPSTPDTVAILMTEDAPDTPWGSLLDRVKPTLFTDFADDRGMGEWLILVTDVVVQGLRDPIPPTSYRWTRAEVQQFVTCGIPDGGQNECSRAFWDAADTIVLAPQGADPRGR